MFLIVSISIACSAIGTKNNLSNTVAVGDAGRQEALIAVVRSAQEISGAIEILNDRGEHIKSVTQVGRNWSPVWSGNGEYLAFLSDRDLSSEARSETRPTNDPFYQPPGHLFVTNIRSGTQVKITSGTFKTWMPRLSPNGTAVAFLSDQNSKGDLYQSPFPDAVMTQLTHDKNWPLESALWLSKSELLYNAFVGDTLDVFRLSLNDFQSSRIEMGAPKGSKTGYLSLSHDNKRLAFVSRDRVKDAQKGKINPQIFVADLDGENRRQLTFDDHINYQPNWSSDDRWIAFLRQVETTDGPRANIYVIDANGNNERLVAATVTSSPAWLPDKNVIVYTSSIANHNRLSVYDLKDGISRQIGDDGADYFEPSTIRR